MVNVLVTVHGIRDNGNWQDAVADLALTAQTVDAVESYKYGFFDLLKFLFPLTRRIQVEVFSHRLRALLDAVVKKYGRGTVVHYAAHSFGTHVIYHAVRALPDNYSETIGNIVLMGSVLPSETDVVELAIRSAKSVFNFASVNDKVLLLNALLPLRSGLAGRVGFKGQFEGAYLQQRFFCFGHGGYFSDLTLGEQSWFARYGLSALSGKTLPQGTHPRPRYGDLLAGFMRFSKLFSTAVLIASFSYIYLFVTADGYISERREKADAIAKSERLSFLDVERILALQPDLRYSQFPAAKTYWNVTRDRLLSRVLLENKTVFALKPDGWSAVTMRESDMAFAVHRTTSNDVLLFEPTASPYGGVSYRGTALYRGNLDAFGFASDGRPFIAIKGGELFLRCPKCSADGWERFSLPPADELDFRSGGAGAHLPSATAVHVLSNGRVLLLASAKLFILSKSALPTTVRIEPNDWEGAATVGTKPKPDPGPLYVRDYEGTLSSYVSVFDKGVSFLINTMSGDSLMIAVDPNHLSSMIDDPQVKGTGGSYCTKTGCEHWEVSFRLARVADEFALSLLAQANEFIAVVSQKDEEDTCSRVATASSNSLTEISVESPIIACPQVLANTTTTELNIRDQYLRFDGPNMEILEKPSAFYPYRKLHSEFVADLDVSSCLYVSGPELLSHLRMVHHNRMLALSCVNRWIFLNEWGVLGGIRIKAPREITKEQAILFVGNRLPFVLSSDNDSLKVFDADGRTVATHSKRNAKFPFATFASNSTATVVWLERDKLVPVRFSLKEGSLVITDLEPIPFPALSRPPVVATICGKHIGTDVSFSFPDNLMDSDEGMREPVLVSPELPFCNDLGELVQSDRIERAMQTVENISLKPRIDRMGSRLEIRLRSNKTILNRALDIVKSIVPTAIHIDTTSPVP